MINYETITSSEAELLEEPLEEEPELSELELIELSELELFELWELELIELCELELFELWELELIELSDVELPDDSEGELKLESAELELGLKWELTPLADVLEAEGQDDGTGIDEDDCPESLEEALSSELPDEDS